MERFCVLGSLRGHFFKAEEIKKNHLKLEEKFLKVWSPCTTKHDAYKSYHRCSSPFHTSILASKDCYIFTKLEEVWIGKRFADKLMLLHTGIISHNVLITNVYEDKVQKLFFSAWMSKVYVLNSLIYVLSKYKAFGKHSFYCQV